MPLSDAEISSVLELFRRLPDAMAYSKKFDIPLSDALMVCVKPTKSASPFRRMLHIVRYGFPWVTMQGHIKCACGGWAIADGGSIIAPLGTPCPVLRHRQARQMPTARAVRV